MEGCPVTTFAGLLAETKRHLSSYAREPLNQLATSITADVDKVTFTYDSNSIQQGAFLQVGLELMYVWRVEESSKTATVARAMQGSTAAAHAAGAIITVNPRFPDFAVAKAINDDLADLSALGLYGVRTVELTATTNSSGYDLPNSNILEVLAITMRHAGTPRTWTPVTNFDLQRNADTDDFASGFALHLGEGTRAGQPIRVVYKTSFAPLVNLTDDVEVVAGLPATMHDLPPMGAAVRLVAPREIKRNFTDSQGDSRRAEEVPPGAVAASMRTVAALRTSRIESEKARLAQFHPDRGFIPQPVGMFW
jgi:hypothetical protein